MRNTHPLATHHALTLFGAACLGVSLACGSDAPSAPDQNDAARIVNIFTQLADSVYRAGGDVTMGNAYASLAEVVRVGGRISPIVITVDGTPTAYAATAMQAEFTWAPCAGPAACAPIVRPTTLRTLFAWQQNDPHHIVRLSSEADANPIRAYLTPTLELFVGSSASLTYFDGKGGIFFGSSGSQKFGISTSTTPCTSATPSRPMPAIYPAPPRCTQADFTVTFNGKAEPSSFLASRSNATGTHTFSMSAQSVLGARYDLTFAFPPLLPPIFVTPNVSLPATLTAKVDSLVTLTLTVSNPSASPATIGFTSGQRYDFTINNASTGAMLWRWSASRSFLQALSTETIPANGALVYTAEWQPESKGTYVATGSLVSVSHRADAKIQLSVP